MKQNNPLISVIVPSYNRAALIGETLRSLQQQTCDDYEIIVVDDGSEDDTRTAVERVAGTKTRYVWKENAERAAARNFGARLARGEYVNFFDSDDLALDNHIAEASAMVARYKNPAWFHLGFAWADPQGKVFREVNNFSGPALNKLLCNGNQLSCNGVFVRKDILVAHPFNEDRRLSASEDYELWLRLAARYPLHYSNAVTSWVIDHEGRSVRTMNGRALLQRQELLIRYLLEDKEAVRYYGGDLKKIRMTVHSYAALHLADQPSFKISSLKCLARAFSYAPGLVGTRRFYATIRNILLRW